MSPSANRPPDEPRGAALRLVGGILAWLTFVLSLAWLGAALRLSRDDIAGIESPPDPIALVQFMVAALGALSAGVGAHRAGWYARTGRGGTEAASSIIGATVLFGTWVLLVVPEW